MKKQIHFINKQKAQKCVKEWKARGYSARIESHVWRRSLSCNPDAMADGQTFIVRTEYDVIVEEKRPN